MQIVIAKVEMTGLKATGRTITRDLNTFPEFAPAPEAKACIWLSEGASEDARKAKDMMPEYTVYTFLSTETDPLGKAKAAALEAFNKKNRQPSLESRGFAE